MLDARTHQGWACRHRSRARCLASGLGGKGKPEDGLCNVGGTQVRRGAGVRLAKRSRCQKRESVTNKGAGLAIGRVHRCGALHSRLVLVSEPRHPSDASSTLPATPPTTQAASSEQATATAACLQGTLFKLAAVTAVPSKRAQFQQAAAKLYPPKCVLQTGCGHCTHKTWVVLPQSHGRANCQERSEIRLRQAAGR